MCHLKKVSIETVHYCAIVIFRTLLTIITITENLIKLILQSLYTFISTIFQAISLLPMCLVFILTSNLRGICFGGGLFGSRSNPFLTIVLIVIILYLLLNGSFLESLLKKMGYTKMPQVSTLSDSGGQTAVATGTPLFLRMLKDMVKNNYEDTEPPVFYVV